MRRKFLDSCWSRCTRRSLSAKRCAVPSSSRSSVMMTDFLFASISLPIRSFSWRTFACSSSNSFTNSGGKFSSTFSPCFTNSSLIASKDCLNSEVELDWTLSRYEKYKCGGKRFNKTKWNLFLLVRKNYNKLNLLSIKTASKSNEIAIVLIVLKNKVDDIFVFALSWYRFFYWFCCKNNQNCVFEDCKCSGIDKALYTRTIDRLENSRRMWALNIMAENIEMRQFCLCTLHVFFASFVPFSHEGIYALHTHFRSIFYLDFNPHLV